MGGKGVGVLVVARTVQVCIGGRRVSGVIPLVGGVVHSWMVAIIFGGELYDL